MAEPSSSVPAAPGIREAFTATDARLESAVFAPVAARRFTVAPFTLALSMLPVELYQRSPFVGVDGSLATEPILIPAAAAPGAKVCLVFAGNAIAPKIAGVVRVLFVKVSVVALPTRVSGPVGIVIVPEFEMVEMIGAVRVLLVRVSVVAFPTRVSVASGRVMTFVPVAVRPVILKLLVPGVPEVPAR